MNKHMLLFVASTFACGLLHAADTRETSVAQEIEQITIVEKAAAVVVVLSPSRSHSTPPRSITPPQSNQSHKRFGSYPGRAGSGSHYTIAPFMQEPF